MSIAGEEVQVHPGRDAAALGTDASVHPERALTALYDGRGGRPVVTWTFLGLCLLVTIPTLVWPRLYEVFGGVEPRRHWWQPFTAALEHGWPGFPGAVHLALNAFLIIECGRPCERLLGSRRFLLLSLLALAANALALSLTEGVNGSSLVIWAWGPALLVGLAWARSEGARPEHSPAYRRVRGILVLMYGVIVLAMGALPYLFGFRGNPLESLLTANLFHLVATAVGAGFAVWSAGHIRDRMRALGAVGAGALDG